MEDFEGDGVFWLDGQDQQVTGTLRYSAAEGATLELIGAFHELAGAYPRPPELIRILGVAGKSQVTLFEALQTGTQFNMPGIVRETYSASVMLLGGHLTSDMPQDFESITVNVGNLAQWVAQSGISVSIEESSPRKVIHSYVPPDAEDAPLRDGGTLSVGFGWSTGGDQLTETYIRQTCQITVEPAAPFGLDGAFEIASAIRNLVSLASHSSCPIVEMTLHHPDFVRDINGKTYPLPLEVRASLGEGESSDRKSWDMLFSYHDFGGAVGVANWIGEADELRPVIGILMSVRHSKQMYTENRMQNVALAAESFHRIRYPNRVLPDDEHAALVERLSSAAQDSDRPWLEKRLQYSNEPNLRRRLIDMIDLAGQPFKDFVGGNGKRFAHVVATARNRLTHYQGTEPRVEGLHYMSEAVYLLVAVCLMRSVGASDEMVTAACSNRHLAWLKAPLAEALYAFE
jgi:hypothetical protein